MTRAPSQAKATPTTPENKQRVERRGARVGRPRIVLTRFHDHESGCRLGYRHDAPANWRIYQSDDGEEWAAVGPVYRSEKELLADLARYAKESWGF